MRPSCLIFGIIGIVYKMIDVLVFLVGLALGSFLNAVVWRLENKKPVGLARSECPLCHHKLNFWDLWPVFSFLKLWGRCRYCRKKISWQYPLVEIACGLGLVFIFNKSVGIWESVFISGIFLLWVLIFVYDFKYLIIPDRFVVVGLVWVSASIFFLNTGNVFSKLFTAIGLFLFFFSMYFFSKGTWVGGGDVKLGFLIGWWLGWPLTLLALLFSYITGAMVGLALLIFKKAGLKTQIPFGPFLVLSSMAAYFYGFQIINWYVQLLS